MDFKKCSDTSVMRNQKEKDKIQAGDEDRLTEKDLLVFTGSIRNVHKEWTCFCLFV